MLFSDEFGISTALDFALEVATTFLLATKLPGVGLSPPATDDKGLGE